MLHPWEIRLAKISWETSPAPVQGILTIFFVDVSNLDY